MPRYGEQEVFFSDAPYRVEVPADVQAELAELDELEAQRMEAFEQQRQFGQGVLETIGV